MATETQTQKSVAVNEEILRLLQQLSALEMKLAPVPAPIPDTFNNSKIFFTPLGEAVADICDKADALYRSAYDFTHSYKATREKFPSKSNAVAWNATSSKLVDAWRFQVESLTNQAESVAAFSSLMARFCALPATAR